MTTYRVSTFLCAALALGSAPPPAVTVFAAASLTGAFREIGDSIRRRDPAARIDFNFAGSQLLAFQIQHGATADVFAPADDRWMRYVRDSGFIAGPARTFARNRLVVIVPASNPARIDKVVDLARPGVKLVLAADLVPAGRYAREALLNLAHAPGFPSNFGQRVLANVVSNEANVKLVATKVQLGEADAGLVYVSDVTPDVTTQVRRLEIPDPYNVVASYPIALISHAPHPAAGRAFIDVVLSPMGQRVLARNGFLPVESSP